MVVQPMVFGADEFIFNLMYNESLDIQSFVACIISPWKDLPHNPIATNDSIKIKSIPCPIWSLATKKCDDNFTGESTKVGFILHLQNKFPAPIV